MFNDLDGDGLKDDGEDGLPGVNVTLFCQDAETGESVQVGSVLTDELGQYNFTGVQPSRCFVQVAPEVDGNDNYVFSPIASGGNQIFPNGTSPEADIGFDDNVGDWNAGMFLPLSTVGPALVYNDLNGDGVQDLEQGEEPLPGVEVTLVCDGQDVATDTTGADGMYEFNDVHPGECHIRVVPAVEDNDNFVFSPVLPEDAPEGTIGNTIHPSNGTSPSVDIGYNTTVDDWNVGMHLPMASIGPSMVFNDLNEDGMHDEDEPPMRDVPIDLVCDGTLRDSTTSNSSGYYEFSNVEPGDCHIQVNPVTDENTTADFSFSPQMEGGNQISPEGASPTVPITYNTTVDDWMVGMFMPPATVGPNQVFNDLDGDGIRDPMEPPLENVTVFLFCYDENGEPVVVGDDTTDANGTYSIENVQPGLCFVVVHPVVNNETYNFSPVVPDGNQIQPNGTSPDIDIDWDQVIDDVDVGMYLPVTLGNKVWEDLDGNGIQDDGEEGIAGLEVTLLDGSGEVVDTTHTADDGSYWFTGLPPGDYSVKFQLPADFEFAPAADLDFDFRTPGDAPPPDLERVADDFIPVNDPSAPAGTNTGVTPTKPVISGENRTDFDAGIYIPVAVGTYHLMSLLVTSV